MAEEWSKPLLAAVTADIKAAKLFDKDKKCPVLWPPVAKLMLTLGNVEAKADDWRKRHGRIKTAEAQHLSFAFDRKGLPGYEEAVVSVISEYECAGARMVEQQAAAARASGVEFPQLKSKPAPGWSGSYLDAIITAQEIMDEQDTSQTKVPIRIPEMLPFATTFSGDWHIGGRGTDHKLLREYFSLWKRLPGHGVIGMGDYAEMFLGKMAGIGVQEHVMPPDMQIAAAMDLIETELNDVLLALLKGNHDNWAGVYNNFVQVLAERIRPTGKDKPGIPYLGIGGEIMLTVGQVEYRLAAWHRYPGAGAVNKGNNQRRASVDHNGPDVVALAHLHNQYGELSRNGEVDQVRCRSGALKVSDEHSRDAAGNIFPDTRMPMVIYHPTRKSMLYFADFRDGIEPLLYFRRRWDRHPDWTTDPAWLDHILTTGA